MHHSRLQPRRAGGLGCRTPRPEGVRRAILGPRSSGPRSHRYRVPSQCHFGVAMRSVESVARKHTVLKPFPGKPGWFEGNCPLCDDDDGSFYIVADGSDEGFECYDCGVKGDALDLEYLLSGEGEIYAEPPNGNGKLPRVISASELLGLELPTVRWAIPDLLPEGVTILAGKPKLGKSWMALGFGITVSTGGVALGTKRVERGEALYLGLEDNHRRLQGRLRKLLVAGDAPTRAASKPSTNTFRSTRPAGLVSSTLWRGSSHIPTADGANTTRTGTPLTRSCRWPPNTMSPYCSSTTCAKQSPTTLWT